MVKSTTRAATPGLAVGVRAGSESTRSAEKPRLPELLARRSPPRAQRRETWSERSRSLLAPRRRHLRRLRRRTVEREAEAPAEGGDVHLVARPVRVRDDRRRGEVRNAVGVHVCETEPVSIEEGHSDAANPRVVAESAPLDRMDRAWKREARVGVAAVDDACRRARIRGSRNQDSADVGDVVVEVDHPLRSGAEGHPRARDRRNLDGVSELVAGGIEKSQPGVMVVRILKSHAEQSRKGSDTALLDGFLIRRGAQSVRGHDVRIAAGGLAVREEVLDPQKPAWSGVVLPRNDEGLSGGRPEGMGLAVRKRGGQLNGLLDLKSGARVGGRG